MLGFSYNVGLTGLLTFTFIPLCVYTPLVPSVSVGIQGQLLRTGFLLPPSGFQGLNSGPEASAEPSHHMAL